MKVSIKYPEIYLYNFQFLHATMHFMVPIFSLLNPWNAVKEVKEEAESEEGEEAEAEAEGDGEGEGEDDDEEEVVILVCFWSMRKEYICDEHTVVSGWGRRGRGGATAQVSTSWK
jgi:hypothetical protein